MDGLTQGGGPEAAHSSVASILAGDPEDEVDYRLRYYGDRELTTPTQPVKVMTPAIEAVFVALEVIARRNKGLGLAANQIGSNAAVAVMKVGGEWLRLVNPFIREFGDAVDTLREGSLSIPGFTISVKRSRTVILAYQNERLDDCTRELRDVEARCADHLCDQMKGVMIVGPHHSRQLRRQCERIGTKARGWA